MDGTDRRNRSGKKLSRPTTRPLTPALFYMRMLENGLSYEAVFYLEVGILQDILTEKANDAYEWPVKGTTADIDKLFGG